MTTNSVQMVNFIQERCLWQFASRAPDREENIRGVLLMLKDLLKGAKITPTTPVDRCHYANANHLASEVKSAFPWLLGLSAEDLSKTISEVMDRLEEITIKQSKNGELHMQAY